jgi:hypothetical protein
MINTSAALIDISDTKKRTEINKDFLKQLEAINPSKIICLSLSIISELDNDPNNCKVEMYYSGTPEQLERLFLEQYAAAKVIINDYIKSKELRPEDKH